MLLYLQFLGLEHQYIFVRALRRQHMINYSARSHQAHLQKDLPKALSLELRTHLHNLLLATIRTHDREKLMRGGAHGPRAGLRRAGNVGHARPLCLHGGGRRHKQRLDVAGAADALHTCNTEACRSAPRARDHRGETRRERGRRRGRRRLGFLGPEEMDAPHRREGLAWLARCITVAAADNKDPV